MKANPNPIPGFKLNAADIRLLNSRALCQEEISEIERWIAGELEVRDADDWHEAWDDAWKYNDLDAPHEDEIGTFDYDSCDIYPDIDTIWKQEGLIGVIKRFGPHETNDTNYGLRSFEEIRQWCMEMEVMPLPTMEDFVTACGPSGLRLPSICINGIMYFDLLCVGSESSDKDQIQRDYMMAQKAVHPYLL